MTLLKIVREELEHEEFPFYFAEGNFNLNSDIQSAISQIGNKLKDEADYLPLPLLFMNLKPHERYLCLAGYTDSVIRKYE